jgi:hypothetical protein
MRPLLASAAKHFVSLHPPWLKLCHAEALTRRSALASLLAESISYAHMTDIVTIP